MAKKVLKEKKSVKKKKITKTDEERDRELALKTEQMCLGFKTNAFINNFSASKYAYRSHEE